MTEFEIYGPDGEWKETWVWFEPARATSGVYVVGGPEATRVRIELAGKTWSNPKRRRRLGK